MIYFCIPAHDEERTVGLLLWKIRTLMSEFGRDFRILVFDDASTDGTAEVLERYRGKVPLEVLSSEERIGGARALDRLLRRAVELAPYPKRDVAVPLQADFTERPEAVVEMVKVIEGGADVVAAVWGEDDRERAPRRVRVSRWLAGKLLGATHDRAPVADPLSSLRAYRVIVLKKAIRELGDEPLLDRESWAGQLQLLERLVPHARRIEETPLEMDYGIRRRETRFRPLRTLWDLLPMRGGAWKGEGAA